MFRVPQRQMIHFDRNFYRSRNGSNNDRKWIRRRETEKERVNQDNTEIQLNTVAIPTYCTFAYSLGTSSVFFALQLCYKSSYFLAFLFACLFLSFAISWSVSSTPSSSSLCLCSTL